MKRIFKLLAWVVLRLAPAVLVTAGMLIAIASWLQHHGGENYDETRAAELSEIAAKRAAIEHTLVEIQARTDRLELEIAAERERAARAEQVIAKLKDLESTWDRFIGNPAQQRANADQARRMERLRDDALARAAAAQQEATRAIWERDSRRLLLDELAERSATVERQTSRTLYFVQLAWRRSKALLIGLAIACLIVPRLLAVVRWWRAPTASPEIAR